MNLSAICQVNNDGRMGRIGVAILVIEPARYLISETRIALFSNSLPEWEYTLYAGIVQNASVTTILSRG